MHIIKYISKKIISTSNTFKLISKYYTYQNIGLIFYIIDPNNSFKFSGSVFLQSFLYCGGFMYDIFATVTFNDGE